MINPTTILLAAATGKAKYGNLPYKIVPMYPHPFSTGYDGELNAVGSPGISASIAGLWIEASRELGESQISKPDLHVWRCTIQPGKNNYVAEVRIHYAHYPVSYIASGMTDYSGEGGTAWHLMEEWLQALATAYGTTITIHDITTLQYDQYLADHSRAIMDNEDL